VQIRVPSIVIRENIKKNNGSVVTSTLRPPIGNYTESFLWWRTEWNVPPLKSGRINAEVRCVDNLLYMYVQWLWGIMLLYIRNECAANWTSITNISFKKEITSIRPYNSHTPRDMRSKSWNKARYRRVPSETKSLLLYCTEIQLTSVNLSLSLSLLLLLIPYSQKVTSESNNKIG
jgi:hypothetical protein